MYMCVCVCVYVCMHGKCWRGMGVLMLGRSVGASLKRHVWIAVVTMHDREPQLGIG